MNKMILFVMVAVLTFGASAQSNDLSHLRKQREDALQRCVRSSADATYASCKESPEVAGLENSIAEAERQKDEEERKRKDVALKEEQARQSRGKAREIAGQTVFMGFFKSMSREDATNDAKCKFTNNEPDSCNVVEIVPNDSGKMPLTLLGRARFNGDKLTLVYVTSVEIKDPEPIMNLLLDKFGKPTSTSVGKVSNAFGAVFPQPTSVWRFKDKTSLTFIHNYERLNNIAIIFDPNNGESPKTRPTKNPF